jgi:hypothetical protein
MNQSDMSRGLLVLLESPDQLPARLEKALVDPGLLAIVRDLEVVVRPPEGSGDLPGEVRERIIQSGLQGLSELEFQLVLERPRTLLELQKAILLDGSDYWDSVMWQSDSRPEPLGEVAPIREVPYYRNPRWWMTHAIVAAVAAVIVAGYLGMELFNAKDTLHLVVAQRNRLERELASSPSVTPADLPESVTEFLVADPPDLPGGDPLDLPESPKTKQSGV